MQKGTSDSNRKVTLQSAIQDETKMNEHLN